MKQFNKLKAIFIFVMALSSITLTGCSLTKSKDYEDKKSVTSQNNKKNEFQDIVYYSTEWTHEWQHLNFDFRHVTVAIPDDPKTNPMIRIKLNLSNDEYIKKKVYMSNVVLLLNNNEYDLNKENSQNTTVEFADNDSKDIILMFFLPDLRKINDVKKVEIEWDIKVQSMEDSDQMESKKMNAILDFSV